jgi:hypothetical protein
MKTAKHAAAVNGHTNQDSATTLRTMVNPNVTDDHDEMMDLNVCGTGDEAYFEWVNEYGDPIGDIFYELSPTDFVEVMSKSILASEIGSHNCCHIEGWPTNNLDGLFDALSRWPLDGTLDLSKRPEYCDMPGNAPYRGLAWGHCVLQYDQRLQKRVAVGTKPIYPEHPDAVRYVGNFIGYSFGFWLDTDDKHLIEKLDAAIAANWKKFTKES